MCIRDRRTGARRWWQPLAALGCGVLLGALFYVRIPLAAANGPPPINWGYADQWEGFWWLVSGAAYRGYLSVSYTHLDVYKRQAFGVRQQEDAAILAAVRVEDNHFEVGFRVGLSGRDPQARPDAFEVGIRIKDAAFHAQRCILFKERDFHTNP